MLPELGILLIAVLGLAFLAWVLASTMSGRYEPIILLWALLAPLANAVLAYPHDRAIITLHRALILPLVVLIPILPPLITGRMTRQLMLPAFCWGMFVIGALFSLINLSSNQLLYGSRTVIDAFILPLLLAWIVYKTFRVREHLAWLHVVICIVSIYLLAIGTAEMITGQDLLPQSGSNGALYAGEGLLQVVRPDGPYANTGTFSTVGMINLFLLLFFRRAFQKVPPLNRLLHWPGVVASIVVSLMTLTRGVVVTYAVILLTEVWRFPELKQRLIRLSCVFAFLAIIVASILYAPAELVRERSDTSDFLARVAQQKQTFRVFWDHPLSGVGITGFITSAELTPRYTSTFAGVEAAGAPHNLLEEIFVDTGLFGAVPFILSQVTIWAVFKKVSLSNPSTGRFVYSYFIMIFAAFWVMNMDFGLGLYSDLNIWFIFALSILYRYVIETAPARVRAVAENSCHHLRSPRFAVVRREKWA